MSGLASVDRDDPLTESYPGAQFVVRVRAREVFANCRRYVHHYSLVERSPFVPSADADPPVPDWKLDEWFAGTLPAEDAMRPWTPTIQAHPPYANSDFRVTGSLRMGPAGLEPATDGL